MLYCTQEQDLNQKIRGKAPQTLGGCFELSDSPGNDVFGSPGDGLGGVKLPGLDQSLGFSNSLQVHIVTGYCPANVRLVDRLGGLWSTGLGCGASTARPNRLRRSIAARERALYFRSVGWVYSHVISSKYYDPSFSLSMEIVITLDYFENFVKFLVISSEAVGCSFSAQ